MRELSYRNHVPKFSMLCADKIDLMPAACMEPTLHFVECGKFGKPHLHPPYIVSHTYIWVTIHGHSSKYDAYWSDHASLVKLSGARC